MSNISTYLEKILSATYGEEVRNSIHDAIESMNNESTNAISQATTANDLANKAVNASMRKIELKETFTNVAGGGGKAYLYQFANLIYIKLENIIYITNSGTYPLITYSEDISTPLKDMTIKISDCYTVNIAKGSREITVTVNSTGIGYSGYIMFLTEELDEYKNTVLEDIKKAIEQSDKHIESTSHLITEEITKRNKQDGNLLPIGNDYWQLGGFDNATMENLESTSIRTGYVRLKDKKFDIKFRKDTNSDRDYKIMAYFYDEDNNHTETMDWISEDTSKEINDNSVYAKFEIKRVSEDEMTQDENYMCNIWITAISPYNDYNKEEKAVGTWIDGRRIYRRVIEVKRSIIQKETIILNFRYNKVLRLEAIGPDGVIGNLSGFQNGYYAYPTSEKNSIAFDTNSDADFAVDYLIIEYTKPTTVNIEKAIKDLNPNNTWICFKTADDNYYIAKGPGQFYLPNNVSVYRNSYQGWYELYKLEDGKFVLNNSGGTPETSGYGYQSVLDSNGKTLTATEILYGSSKDAIVNRSDVPTL